jgi:hypothetical protein
MSQPTTRKVAVFYGKLPERTFSWVPLHVEPDLLVVLNGALHPETIPPGCEDLVPKNAEELLRLVLHSIHINWEDIPDPGNTSARNN